MWKKLQLHTVATDKVSSSIPMLLKGHISGQWQISSVSRPDFDESVQPHYLYLLSDNEIKEGDWYLSNIEKDRWVLLQSQTNGLSAPHLRKVVATTNPDLCNEILTVKCPRCNASGFEPSNAPNRCKECYGKGTTIKIEKGLPNISQSLIQYFVQQQGNVKEVMVEYHNITTTCPECGHIMQYDAMRCDKCHEEMSESDTNYLPTTQLSLTPSGEITWKPVEEKVYTREEVLNILNERWNYTHTDLNPLSIQEWFEKYY